MKKNILAVLIGFIFSPILSQNEITEKLKTEYEAEHYEQIINLHSEKVKGYTAKAVYYVGMAYYMKADDNNCLKLMNLSIEKDKTDPDAYFIKGRTLNYIGNITRQSQHLVKPLNCILKVVIILVV